ncbi:MAG: AsmA family protein, partial [Magnetovibrio sp.]|nr:AsmA family protein [Magnetovibrio sp.]
MKLSRMAKIMGALGVLLVAGVVASVAVLKSIDLNDFKTDIEALAKKATGRNVTIAGNLDLTMSLAPSLNMNDVTVGNAAWASDEPMMVLKSLKANVDLLSLLSGKVNVDYFVIDGLSLVFETDGKGLANWEFERQAETADLGQTAGGLSITPIVRDVRLNNIDLTYIDGATKARFHVKLARVNANAATYDSPMTLDIKAAYNGVDFDVNSKLGSLKHLIGSGGGAFPVNLNITANGIDLKIDGGVDQPRAGMKVDVRVTADVSNMAALNKLSGTDLSVLKSIKAAVRVQGRGAEYTFSDLNLVTAGSDLSGDIAVDLSQARPKFTATLKSKVLDVDGLKGGEASPSTPSLTVFNTDPISLLGMKMVDFDVSFQADKVLLKPLHITTVNVQAKLQDGLMKIRGLKMKLGGGEVAGTITVNGSKKIPAVSIDLNLRGIDAGHLAADFGAGDLATLKLKGKVALASVGTSTRALASRLNGSVRLAGENGRINAGVVQGLGAIEIRCFVGQLPIKNGDVVAKTVILDSPDFEARVTGNIDLPGERFHLTVVPHAKTTSLASFAVPVRLKGALNAPRIGFDAGE